MPLPLIPIIGVAAATAIIPMIKYMLPVIILGIVKLLGVTLITFGALNLATDQIENIILTSFDNIGTDALLMFKMVGFIDSINILIAGWAAQIQLRSLLGAFNKMKFTPST
jgi:cell division protein FtsX